MIKNKIAIDLTPTQPVSFHEYHGGGEYAKRIFNEIAKNATNQNIVCVYNPKKPILPEIEDICRRNKFEMIKFPNNGKLGTILLNAGVNKFYSALPSINQYISSEIEYIYTIHGLRVIEMPTDRYEVLCANSYKDYLRYIYKQLFKQKYVSKQKLKFKQFLSEGKNKTIIVPSYHTKYSILGSYPELKNNKINVLYSPRTDINPNQSINIQKDFQVSPNKFILLILGSRWIKNNYRAALAIDEMYTQNPEIEIKTLIIGVNLNKNVFRKLKNKDRFILRGYVDSDILERLYKDAFLFVYPTLNEGFGYPPLEAMKYGTPVIASAISSVTEVCGDSALYFNPYSVDEIKNRILQVLYEDRVKAELIAKGRIRFEKVKVKQQLMLDELIQIVLND